MDQTNEILIVDPSPNSLRLIFFSLLWKLREALKATTITKQLGMTTDLSIKQAIKIYSLPADPPFSLKL